MASSLLGYWPGEWTEASSACAPLFTDRSRINHSRVGLSSQHARVNGEICNHIEPLREEDAPSEDDIYDAPTPSPMSSSTVASSFSSSPASILQSLATGNPEIDDTDWRVYHPPPELINVPAGTSMEIESFIEASVEKLQSDLAEEESLRYSVTWKSSPEEVVEIIEPMIILSVNNDAQEKDVEFQISSDSAERHSRGMSENGNLSRRKSRASNAGHSTASSRDSGYGSGLGERTSTRSRIGSIFSLGGTFKRSRDRLHITRQTSPLTKECISCLDDFKSKDLVDLTCHSYCKPCFQTLISTALSSEDHWPPKCCLNEIPTETVLAQLSTRIKRKYQDVSEERSVPAGDRIYCSKASCAAWIPPKNISKPISCAICSFCRQKTCTSCRGIYHSDGECPEDPTLKATLALANDEGWRRCYSCNAMVEHNQGCIHMTCKCKAQFCYICGLKWRTCSCIDDQLDEILRTAQMRRLSAEAQATEAQARERMGEEAAQAAAELAEQEAADLREMLEEIERYETEEALKLARAEEEARLVAVTQRQQRQEERIIAINKRYFELKGELDFLHALQKIAMQERHEAALRTLRANNETQKKHLNLNLEIATAETDSSISNSQNATKQAYQALRSKERQVEDQYHADLKAYWADKPGADTKIAESMNVLRAVHADSYHKWDAAEKQKHQKVVDASKEEIDSVKQKLDSKMAAVQDRMRREEMELRKTMHADGMWLVAVARVRGEMLQSMEGDEYAREDE